eukprot:scaffold4562_cov255-Pinguiococcus_pyrenoidosus.AAC.9
MLGRPSERTLPGALVEKALVRLLLEGHASENGENGSKSSAAPEFPTEKPSTNWPAREVSGVAAALGGDHFAWLRREVITVALRDYRRGPSALRHVREYDVHNNARDVPVVHCDEVRGFHQCESAGVRGRDRGHELRGAPCGHVGIEQTWVSGVHRAPASEEGASAALQLRRRHGGLGARGAIVEAAQADRSKAWLMESLGLQAEQVLTADLQRGGEPSGIQNAKRPAFRLKVPFGNLLEAAPPRRSLPKLDRDFVCAQPRSIRGRRRHLPRMD